MPHCRASSILTGHLDTGIDLIYKFKNNYITTLMDDFDNRYILNQALCIALYVLHS